MPCQLTPVWVSSSAGKIAWHLSRENRLAPVLSLSTHLSTPVPVHLSTCPCPGPVPLSQLQERDEQARLAELASRGLVTLPKRTSRKGFQGPALPNRGKLASEMVIEDRR